jgi:hypothetical protein
VQVSIINLKTILKISDENIPAKITGALEAFFAVNRSKKSARIIPVDDTQRTAGFLCLGFNIKLTKQSVRIVKIITVSGKKEFMMSFFIVSILKYISVLLKSVAGKRFA